jgi:hypothetical protein
LSNDLAAYLFNHAASPPSVYGDSDIESQESILSPGTVEKDQIPKKIRPPIFREPFL